MPVVRTSSIRVAPCVPAPLASKRLPPPAGVKTIDVTGGGGPVGLPPPPPPPPHAATDIAMAASATVPSLPGRRAVRLIRGPLRAPPRACAAGAGPAPAADRAGGR